MSKIDRLSALIENFRLKVVPVAPNAANLIAFQPHNSSEIQLEFHPQSKGVECARGVSLFTLFADFGSSANPVLAALPDMFCRTVQPDDEIAPLVQMLANEQMANRCGGAAVLGRLGEVLLVRILRELLDTNTANSGMLAGLADARLSRAIVQMHDNPGRDWRNADLAEIAGLSHSRFKELFVQIVGENPGSYLRRWRLTLAKSEIERGRRVDMVARKYGYQAPDAFSRAFSRQFGIRPKSLAMQHA